MQIPGLKDKFSELIGKSAAVTNVEPGPATSAPMVAVNETEHARRGGGLDVGILPQQIVAAAELLDAAHFALESITGVDWLAEQQMEVIYDFTCFDSGERVVLRTRVPRAQPELASITDVFPSANWHERETHDFFGIKFSGHPELIPLLLPEDATFHPLLKDFKA